MLTKIQLTRDSLKASKIFTHIDFDKSKLNKAVQINEEGRRLYQTPSGASYPSITTVMGWLKSSQIAEWRTRVGAEAANQITRRAASRGTSLHNICEKYLLNESEFGEVPYNVIDMFKVIRPVLDNNIDNIYCIETKMYSDHLGVAGTTDCIAEYNGKRSIIDFKTTRKPKERSWIKEYFMQAAGYSVMFEELTGISVPRLVIIMVSDEMDLQIFEEKRDDYVSDLIDSIGRYKLINS